MLQKQNVIFHLFAACMWIIAKFLAHFQTFQVQYLSSPAFCLFENMMKKVFYTKVTPKKSVTDNQTTNKTLKMFGCITITTQKAYTKEKSLFLSENGIFCNSHENPSSLTPIARGKLLCPVQAFEIQSMQLTIKMFLLGQFIKNHFAPLSSRRGYHGLRQNTRNAWVKKARHEIWDQ